MSSLPPIEDIALASLHAGLGADPSELHGALCGWLSGGGENAVNASKTVYALVLLALACGSPPPPKA
jgi:uncharacterized protein YgfB (UPF0149 family)